MQYRVSFLGFQQATSYEKHDQMKWSSLHVSPLTCNIFILRSALCHYLNLEQGKQPAALSWPDKEVMPIRGRFSRPGWCCARISSSNVPSKNIWKDCALCRIVLSFNSIFRFVCPCSTSPSSWSTSSMWPYLTFLHGSERRWLNWIISAGRPLRWTHLKWWDSTRHFTPRGKVAGDG